MSFIDKITGDVMQSVKDLVNPSDWSSLLSIDLPTVNLDAWYAAAITADPIAQVIADCGDSADTLYTTLTDIINSEDVTNTGFESIGQAQSLLNALIDSADTNVGIYGTYAQLGKTTTQSTRMSGHTQDVKANLPDIMKVSGTAGAMRGLTEYTPVTDPDAATPANCSQDGKVIAELVAGVAPATTSPLSEVAGTLTSEGDALQQATFDCADDLIAQIKIGDTTGTFSISLGNTMDSLNSKALDPDWKGLPDPGPEWWEDGITDLNTAWTTMKGWSSYTDLLTAAACSVTANDNIESVITTERANAGLTGVVGAMDPIDLESSALVAEIKENSAASNVTTFNSDPCAQDIASRYSAPDSPLATMASVVTVDSITQTSSTVSSTEVQSVEEVAETAEEEAGVNIDDRKARLARQLGTVVWVGQAYELMVRQIKGLDDSITLSVDIDVGTIYEVDYVIPTNSLVPVPAAGESEDYRLMPSPGNTEGKNLLTGLVKAIKAVVPSSVNLKVWVFQSPVTGNYSIAIFAPQGTALDVVFYNNFNDTSKFWTGIFPNDPVSYITDYMYSLESEAELDEFETNILTGILP